jgi:hypothetical protein
VTDEVKAVEFVAEVRQVKTMADHTVNLTLNMPEYCVQQAAWFLQHQGGMIQCVSLLQALTNDEDGHEEQIDERTKVSPLGVDSG